ncbi:MAG TPA: BamA/TamA family outer membrane protein [Sphingobium sp.]|uniref:BamA/TamA family outer membrane protein n=1 Tax=Sphingobium sp. TaxID=1912891 RepID=UPI002ED5754E
MGTMVQAQQRVSEELPQQAQTLTPSEIGSGEAVKKSKKAELLVVPIPMSNPAMGTGITVAAVAFYNPNDSSQPWVSGAGAGYTSTESWGGGAFHSMSLGHDAVRVLGFIGYGDARLKFYGIGPEAGSQGVSVQIEDKALVGLADVQWRPIKHGLLRHVYAGARLMYLDIDSTVQLPHPFRPDLSPSPLELRSKIVSIGPSFTFDSRNSSLNPRKGVYVTGTWLFGAKFLGSDFDQDKMQIGVNAYFPLGKNTVLGVRKQLCSVSSNAPFYDLCMFGQQGDLRGYETGRYRDGATWALQAEIRQHLFWRLGMVAFAGVGGIADSSKDIWKHSTVLSSGGAGLRFLASKRNNVNVRFDAAYGKDGFAFYFGIGEAF